MATKIFALTGAPGNLVRFEPLPGHCYDNVGVPPLIDGRDALRADKEFDITIVADSNARGVKIVVSQRPRRAAPLPIDPEIYKWRDLTENFFCKLKEFNRIAMRSD
ncbi:hypothetical protein GGE07_006388 [Sinorhizobium terangae]|uniref:hypothetical protein n=1 Tax=Sinorhizobium terangae TaxID=110322 RepID=UPI001795CDF5|nr:hypothetical protein [Sinorhizobium terangae]MBB4189691.1 hypothetical protein [Sinorhizobium terangae]